MICQGGKPSIAKKRRRKIKNAIQKSIRQTRILENGRISLGKYTLVRRLEFAVSELLTSEMVVEMSCQKTIPAETTTKRWVKFCDLSTR